MQPNDTADATVQAAYDYFNAALFDDLLPPCKVVFQRGSALTSGFVPAPGRGSADNQIFLNRSFFGAVSSQVAMQMLVHEMIHLWQFHFGRPPVDKAHNAEFAAKSIALGLMPSSTGLPGGERTGGQVIDYVVRGGKFERAVLRASAMWEGAFPRAASRLSRAR